MREYLLGVLTLLACVDAVDDVHYALYGIHMYPSTVVGKFLNLLFEFIAIIASSLLIMAVLPYVLNFFNPFWMCLAFIAIAVFITSVHDLTTYVTKSIRYRRKSVKQVIYVK